MTHTKRLIRGGLASLLTLSAIALSGNALADECSIVGSWVGGLEGAPGTLITYEGKKGNRGTKDLEFLLLDPQFTAQTLLQGLSPSPCYDNAAEAVTAFRGVWERSGGDDDDERNGNQIYRTTLVGYGTKLSGSPATPLSSVIACGMRLTSTKTMSDDCNTLDFTFTFEFFEPGTDVLTGTPVSSWSNVSAERRIEGVDEP